MLFINRVAIVPSDRGTTLCINKIKRGERCCFYRPSPLWKRGEERGDIESKRRKGGRRRERRERERERRERERERERENC